MSNRASLEAVIDRMEELQTANCPSQCTTVSLADLDILTQAARLLCEIHGMADGGQLDGVDLEWMVAADGLILGEPAT